MSMVKKNNNRAQQGSPVAGVLAMHMLGFRIAASYNPGYLASHPAPYL